ncbi:hypothetical protein NUACC21_49220 [Scytonema sp. NUACC21]
MKNDNIRILFLTAEPNDTSCLRVTQELRDIKEKIQQANLRDRFLLEYSFSARPGDISQAILNFTPQIVHFSGHGTSHGELCFENEFGQAHPVEPKALAALFELVADSVRCVILNACYSDAQAKAIVKHIPFIIGMRKEIEDRAAIAFAVGFYKALGANRSIEEAYEFGCVETQLQGLSENLIPIIRKKADKAATDFYIERPPIEQLCYKAIKQQGALIRIKAPEKMGKTSLMNKVLRYARGCNYQTLTLSCQNLVDGTVTTDLKRFLRSFCVVVGNELGLPNKLNEYWDNQASCNYNSRYYFQKYLLPNINSPIVLALDNVDLVFEHPKIAPDFCKLLRNWNDLAKRGDSNSIVWEKLRLIIVHSTEVYASLDINSSPLANVGVVIDLPEFTPIQVQRLVKRHRLDWTLDRVEQLMAVVGGHPLLVRIALDSIKLQQKTLEEILQAAPTASGIFSDHLRELWKNLEKNSELKTAFSKVVKSDEENQVQLNPMQVKSLQRLGLVTLHGHFAKPRCELYRQYFRMYLQD